MSAAGSTPTRRITGAVIAVVAIGTFAAACGGSSPKASVNSGSTPQAGTGQNGPANIAGFSTAAGKVTKATTGGAVVKSSSGVKDVAFGSVTTFTSTTSATRSDVAAGDCIEATPVFSGARRALPTTVPTAAATTRPTARPTARPSVPTKLTASAITITGTTACKTPSFSGRSGTGSTNGFGGGELSVPSGTPSPGQVRNFGGNGSGSGAFPGGGFGGFGGFGSSGTVTSISGSAIVVKSAFGSTSTTVTTTSATTYSVRATAHAADVKAGQCLTAVGSTASGGVLDARTVSLSAPTNGTCPAATFSRVGRFAPGGQAGGSGQGVGGAGA